MSLLTRLRRVAGPLTTALAVLLVLVALVAPSEVGALTPGSLVRLPLEGLVGLALLLVLPGWVRRPLAVLIGVALGLLVLLKLLDMGFVAAWDRPFDPVLDWVLFDDAANFLTNAIGRTGAIAALVALAVLVVALLVVMTLAVWRLTRLAVRHDDGAARAVAALGVVWVTCAVLGAQLVPGVPVAADSAAALVHDRALDMRATVADERVFAEQKATDAFRGTPSDQLLTGLRGKDVVLAFIESYGRSAVEDPEFAPQVGALLDGGTRRLTAAGLGARSGFLTSSTAGGASWLAHSTFLSGLWIDNQQRYGDLVASDRLTLVRAFHGAGWRTVGVMPGLESDWPEGAFYGFDHVYDSRNIDYRGPKFSWSPMPDQYLMSLLERDERATPDRAPLMAEIDLTSSHAPWSPTPRLVGWDAVGDGSIFATMPTAADKPEAILTRDPALVRADYRTSVEYSMDTLISYLETYGDDDLVMIVLGDHQPSPIVTGPDASRDVPVSIVARDPAVLDRIAGWGWTDGLKPAPQAPVWPMDAIRDRFLTAFGPAGSATATPSGGH